MSINYIMNNEIYNKTQEEITEDKNTSNNNSLFRFNLNIDKEYIPMINDIIRLSVIQLVAQLLFFMTNPSKNPLFSDIFIQTLFYLLIGIVVYWLIIRKLIIIN